MNKFLLACAVTLGAQTVMLATPALAKADAHPGVRMLAKIEMPNDAGNAAVRDGSLGRKLQQILGGLKPEASYFTLENGHRTAYVFFTLQNSSQIPGLLEPAFLELNAKIELIPVMSGADLQMGMPGLEKAAKASGK